jgi:hypothetical protein
MVRAGVRDLYRGLAVTIGGGASDTGSPHIGTYPIVITNAGFEAGDLTGWTSDGGKPFVDDGSAYDDSVNAARTGTYMCLIGVTLSDAIRQTVDVSVYATAIDDGTGTFDLSAYLKCVNSDTGHVGVGFYNGSSALLGSEITGTATRPNSVFTEKTLSEAIPVGTRSVEIILAGTVDGSGSVCQAYWDDVSASVTFG